MKKFIIAFLFFVSSYAFAQTADPCNIFTAQLYMNKFSSVEWWALPPAHLHKEQAQCHVIIPKGKLISELGMIWDYENPFAIKKTAWADYYTEIVNKLMPSITPTLNETYIRASSKMFIATDANGNKTYYEYKMIPIENAATSPAVKYEHDNAWDKWSTYYNPGNDTIAKSNIKWAKNTTTGGVTAHPKMKYKIQFRVVTIVGLSVPSYSNNWVDFKDANGTQVTLLVDVEG